MRRHIGYRPARRVALATAGLALICSAAPANAETAIGGALRARAEGFDAAPFGAAGPQADEYLLWRALAHVDWTPDPAARMFVELGWHDQTGRDGASAPTDENGLDLHQGWIEWRPTANASVRVGRQELPLGSGRLVALRDGPNVRRAFDAAQAEVRSGVWRVRAIAAASVTIEPDAFDDQADEDDRFGGLYATHGGPRRGVDLYVLGQARENARFLAGAGEEERLSFGTRLFGAPGPFDYDIEIVWQTGAFRDGDIRAWTVATHVGRRFDGPFSPRLGLKANVTSGDDDARDGALETFNPLYPNLAYFNDAALLMPQNHMDVQPTIQLALAKTLRMDAGANWFWKTDRADAIYRAPGVPFGGATQARFVGAQYALGLTWAPREAMEVRAVAVRFEAGAAMREAGGSDATFGLVNIAYRL